MRDAAGFGYSILPQPIYGKQTSSRRAHHLSTGPGHKAEASFGTQLSAPLWSVGNGVGVGLQCETGEADGVRRNGPLVEYAALWIPCLPLVYRGTDWKRIYRGGTLGGIDENVDGF